MTLLQSRWLRIVLLGAVVIVAVAGVELVGRLQPDVSISPIPPEGYAIDSEVVRQDPDVEFVDQSAISLRRIDDTFPEVDVVVRDYPMVWSEKIMSFRLVPPGNLLDLDLGVRRERLDGAGIGSDAIQCNLDGPDGCIEWAYWSHSGTQLVTIVQARDDEPQMTESEFRSLVEQVLQQQS